MTSICVPVRPCTKDKLDKAGILAYMNDCQLWFGLDEFVVGTRWCGELEPARYRVEIESGRLLSASLLKR
jgi:hypothetical protein